ncbi:hypothetical protein JCM10908_000031 [Rhodotorula pacifica]|uniref:zinc finger MYND domain-containing protein n=1 Tax=Rhodotorula pacifica TaxID=1495444 RepID=UPI00316E5DFA
MASAPDGRGSCLVCGKESTLRCSACASKGGIDLFFCSKEHQKLIWPYHRLVCGERSHPFKLPPFSKEEAEIACTRATEVPESAKDAEHQDRLQRLLEIEEYSREELKARLDTLIGIEIPMTDHRYPPDSLKTSSLVAYTIRMTGSLWSSSVPSKSPELAFVETFGGFYFDLRHSTTIADDSLWYSEYCHRVAAQLALGLIVTSIEDRGGTPDDTILKAREDNLIAIRHFSETATDPKFANFAAAVFRSADGSLGVLRKMYGTRTVS